MGGEMDNAATDAMHADQTLSDKSTTNQPILRPFLQDSLACSRLVPRHSRRAEAAQVVNLPAAPV
jgi:hypothetical protein